MQFSYLSIEPKKSYMSRIKFVRVMRCMEIFGADEKVDAVSMRLRFLLSTAAAAFIG